MRTDDTDTAQALGAEVDNAEWDSLKPHAERNALIVVARDLDLAEVGAKFAQDETETVEYWMEAGKIARPSEQQLTEWNSVPARQFRFLIVRPFVLVQEQYLH